MGLEGKNFFDTQSILHRRKLLFTAGAAVGIFAGAAATSRFLIPRATLTSATPREDLEVEEAPPAFNADARALELRGHYQTARLWHPRTIAVFGSDLREGSPVFQTPQAVQAVRARSKNAVVVSGLVTDPRNRTRYADKDSIRKAKQRALHAIAEGGRTPTTLLLTAHGGESGIQIGQYVDKSSGEIHSVFITPEELADAYARKYRGMGARLAARQSPDILAFVNCASGRIAEEFLTALQRAEIEQEPRRVLHAFKPTAPIIFSASTGDEISYINQLLFEMSEHETVGEMYASADRIGGRQFSNPGIRVPDTETGAPVIVGSSDSNTRFA